ncbi:hypothetical protein DFS34DRAFT_633512 [Phlyctochytrium arcticum]|nr:hypothetical protein DFS34DRAFT_633512 [Phlyctochytrium arcticum]
MSPIQTELGSTEGRVKRIWIGLIRCWKMASRAILLLSQGAFFSRLPCLNITSLAVTLSPPLLLSAIAVFLPHSCFVLSFILALVPL